MNHLKEVVLIWSLGVGILSLAACQIPKEDAPALQGEIDGPVHFEVVEE